jgi:hypothetical protein
VRSQDHTQARGVDELQILKVQHDYRGCPRLDLLDLALQQGSPKQVEFAVKSEHHPVGLSAHIDSKMLAGGRHD